MDERQLHERLEAFLKGREDRATVPASAFIETLPVGVFALVEKLRAYNKNLTANNLRRVLNMKIREADRDASADSVETDGDRTIRE